MRTPHLASKVNGGCGAFTCEFAKDHVYGMYRYIEIQVHPGRVQIDIYQYGAKTHSGWYTDEIVLGLCIALCSGGDCVGQLADAIEECGGCVATASDLRKAGELIAEYFQKLSLTPAK